MSAYDDAMRAVDQARDNLGGWISPELEESIFNENFHPERELPPIVVAPITLPVAPRRMYFPAQDEIAPPDEPTADEPWSPSPPVAPAVVMGPLPFYPAPEGPTIYFSSAPAAPAAVEPLPLFPHSIVILTDEPLPPARPAPQAPQILHIDTPAETVDAPIMPAAVSVDISSWVQLVPVTIGPGVQAIELHVADNAPIDVRLAVEDANNANQAFGGNLGPRQIYDLANRKYAERVAYSAGQNVIVPPPMPGGQTAPVIGFDGNTPIFEIPHDVAQAINEARAASLPGINTTVVPTATNLPVTIDDRGRGVVSPAFDPTHRLVGWTREGNEVYQLTDEAGTVVEWAVLSGHDSREMIDGTFHPVGIGAPLVASHTPPNLPLPGGSPGGRGSANQGRGNADGSGNGVLLLALGVGAFWWWSRSRRSA